MANAVSSTIGLLINNSSPLPDGSVGNPNVQTMAFAGTTQATAATLTAPFVVVSNNTTANGGILPVGTINQTIMIAPSQATNAPKVYPPLGGTINFGTVNASVAPTAQKITEFRCLDNTGLNWATLGL